MLSFFARNLFFTILQPGIVAGLLPYLILKSKVENSFEEPLKFYHYWGAIVFVTGLIIMLICIISFAVYGHGTLSPADPTKRLVVKGLYKFSRNPMYVGVVTILIGEAIFFQSGYLFIYTIFVFTVFNIFIIFKEEPRLMKDFGEDYKTYRNRTRKWV